MPLKLLKGITNFKHNQFQAKRETFAALSKGQAPDVLFITCSDSRIVPTLFTGANVGELFVIRNAGNIIAPYSTIPSGEAATIEFALKHLNVSEIIVCGHSHCGAMKGLLGADLSNELPAVAAWLEHAKPALARLQHAHEASRLKDLTQHNILLQIENLKKHPAVAEKLQQGTLKIHGWYYEFEHGEIYIYNLKKNTFVSFEETVADLAKEKLHHVVETEALNYLANLTPVKNIHDFEVLKKFTHLNQVTSIWEQIKPQITEKLLHELGEFYLEADEKISPQFNELLKIGSSIRVRNTEAIRKSMEESPFYNLSTVLHKAHFFAIQKKDGEKLNIPILKAKL